MRQETTLKLLQTMASGTHTTRELVERGGLSSATVIDSNAPVDDETAAVAQRWRVENPLSVSVITGMFELYGSD